MLTRLPLLLVRLICLLPLRFLAPIGQGLGMVLYFFGWERRNVARINLERCFPDWSLARRREVLRAHFRAAGRALLEQGILWWSSKERIERTVAIEEVQHLHAAQGKPTIVLAFHFLGVEMGNIRLSTEYRGVSVFANQKNPVFRDLLFRSRTRFGHSLLLSRQDGIRPVIKAMREGRTLLYLPDQDFGPKDAIFSPFFGVPAATVTGLSRLARLTGACVIPFVTRQLPGAQGYVGRFYPAWDNYPGESVEADTLRMNQFLEQRVLEMPEQYFWMHKRFKTRPPGEESPY
jgi:Kdo2-lipid IVA lauroyltransferase/acyltransferase